MNQAGAVAPRVAFLCGKGGGDFIALERARNAGLASYETVAFITSACGSSAAAEFERQHPGRSAAVFDGIARSRAASFEAMLGLLQASRCEWIFLCGFGYLLPPALVGSYRDRIVNAHHAPLPDHPGLFRKEWLVERGEPFLGATVHRVDEGMDTGPQLASARFPNFGMPAFAKVLRYYRFVQDVLVTQAFRDLTGASAGRRAGQYLDIHFSPAVETRVLELFERLHGFADHARPTAAGRRGQPAEGRIQE